MASAKSFIISESIGELKKLQKASIPMIANRIRALIAFILSLICIYKYNNYLCGTNIKIDEQSTIKN